MASLDEQSNIRVHEPDLHSNIHAIRQHRVQISSPSLNEAENIIPSSAVESTRVRPQLVQNLLHLERRGERLYQHSSADTPDGDAQVGLGKEEDVGPEARFEVVLHFGEVEVGAGVVREEVGGVVEEVHGEVEDGAGDGTVVDFDAGLVEVPSSGSVAQRRRQ